MAPWLESDDQMITLIGMLEFIGALVIVFGIPEFGSARWRVRSRFSPCYIRPMP